MNRKIWLLGGVAILIAIGGFYIFSNRSSAPTKANLPGNEPKTAEIWVEIKQQSVSAVGLDGKTRSLKTGDTVVPGEEVQTSASGRVAIYFPSGSVARLDGSTNLKISAAELAGDQSSLSVKLELLTGRVWSKIANVANIHTTWEVKTTNAVAVVRGTAFSMKFKNHITSVVGAEHTVEVKPLDPKTGEPLDDKKVNLDPKQIVNIGDGDTELKVNPASSAVLKETWFSENTNADVKVDSENTPPSAPNPTSGENPTPTPTPTPNTNPAPTPSPITNPGTTSGGGGGSTGSTASISGLKISGPATVTEGDPANFKAILSYSDGTMKDVTASAKWSASSEIGSISGGVFKALISANLGDVPSATGRISAQFVSGDKTWTAATDVQVDAFVEVINPTGQ